MSRITTCEHATPTSERAKSIYTGKEFVVLDCLIYGRCTHKRATEDLRSCAPCREYVASDRKPLEDHLQVRDAQVRARTRAERVSSGAFACEFRGLDVLRTEDCRLCTNRGEQETVHMCTKFNLECTLHRYANKQTEKICTKCHVLLERTAAES